MSETLKWIGNNLGLGGLLRHATSATGTVLDRTLKGVGEIAEFVSGESDVGRQINSGCNAIGKTLDTAITETGKGLGHVADKTIEYSSIVDREFAGGIAKLAGASEENVLVAEMVGAVVVAVGVGTLAGAVIANAAVSVAAASGTAGAAATTSGLAALGGGSVAASGGGMATGLAVVQAITVAGATSGAATLTKQEEKNEGVDEGVGLALLHSQSKPSPL